MQGLCKKYSKRSEIFLSVCSRFPRNPVSLPPKPMRLRQMGMKRYAQKNTELGRGFARNGCSARSLFFIDYIEETTWHADDADAADLRGLKI